MKKILVFGATGKVGLQVVTENIHAGNQVTILTRDENYPLQHPNLKIVQGNILEEANVHAILKNQDVIISAVGNRDYTNPQKIVFPLVQNVVNGLIQFDLNKRIIILGGAGLLQYDETKMYKDLDNEKKSSVAYPRADHFATYQFIQAQPIMYTLICPPQITDDPADGNYNVAENYFPENTQWFISAGNIAHFITSEIQAEKFINKRVGIGTKE